mgnify:FL=1
MPKEEVAVRTRPDLSQLGRISADGTTKLTRVNKSHRRSKLAVLYSVSDSIRWFSLTAEAQGSTLQLG